MVARLPLVRSAWIFSASDEETSIAMWVRIVYFFLVILPAALYISAVCNAVFLSLIFSWLLRERLLEQLGQLRLLGQLVSKTDFQVGAMAASGYGSSCNPSSGGPSLQNIIRDDDSCMMNGSRFAPMLPVVPVHQQGNFHQHQPSTSQLPRSTTSPQIADSAGAAESPSIMVPMTVTEQAPPVGVIASRSQRRHSFLESVLNMTAETNNFTTSCRTPDSQALVPQAHSPQALPPQAQAPRTTTTGRRCSVTNGLQGILVNKNDEGMLACTGEQQSSASLMMQHSEMNQQQKPFHAPGTSPGAQTASQIRRDSNAEEHRANALAERALLIMQQRRQTSAFGSGRRGSVSCAAAVGFNMGAGGGGGHPSSHLQPRRASVIDNA
ncbi:unnamed protein product, partial [Amoebophrya sp. A25]|eukprot:GSA25T00012825001.1